MPDVPMPVIMGMGGMGRAGAARGQSMDLMTAKKMVAAVEAAAAAKKQNIAVCVMDANGDVVAFERMNGTDRIPLATSQGKARAVLMFGVPTAMIADAQRDKKPVTATIKALPIGGGGGEITLLRGGLPILKDGKMIGAIGVGGSASGEDEGFRADRHRCGRSDLEVGIFPIAWPWTSVWGRATQRLNSSASEWIQSLEWLI